jgi:general stress protein CsbA
MGFPIDILSIGGIFVLTQGLAVFLGAFRFEGSFVEYLMVFVDVVSIIMLVLMVNYVRQQSTR